MTNFNQLIVMKKKFLDMSIFQFQKRFPNDKACYAYLAKCKWPHGFKCERCSHTKCCQGKGPQYFQCTKCRYQASPTSGTMFHKTKLPLLKAFYIIYYTVTSKHGIASTELSRKLGLRQKTCWAFQQKIARAIAGGTLPQLYGKVEVDESVVGAREQGVKGRKNIKKRLIVVGLELKGKGVARMYSQVI